MRIDSIAITNFRGIEQRRLDFDPHFTLLVGDNGSGKTSILSAVSVALGIWHLSDMLGDAQWRNIMDHEMREMPDDANGERQFRPTGQAQITATGTIGRSAEIEWRRGKLKRGAKTLNEDSVDAQDAIDAVLKARENKEQALPLLAYYGAGRAWLPSNKREMADLSGDLKSRQEDGYYDCLNERIRIKDVMKWFLIQASRRDASGRFKPAYEAVRLALQRGIPGVDEIYWDANKAELVVSINGAAQPFSYLSDGQRTMASTIADMAIRAVTLNTHLLGDGNGHEHPEKVLEETPGVVLIDELDVHLHPIWQRRVIDDLKATFPNVQFICTSHSPLLIQTLPPTQFIRLDGRVPADWEGENSVEDVLEDVQGVDQPQRSRKAKEAQKAAETYFTLLRHKPQANLQELAEAELKYREASSPYSDTPALDAILKLEALAAVRGGEHK